MNLTPANDNRPRKNWPTGKRLLTAGRHADYAMLLSYRGLLDIATSPPANDNWRNPAPGRGQVDYRAAEERTDNVEAILCDALPTIQQLRDASGVEWGVDPAPCHRSTLVHSFGNAELRQLGGLKFFDGALWTFQTPSDREPQRPRTLRAPHRAKKADPALVPSSGGWAIDDYIDAKREVTRLQASMPRSSAALLELALGPTRAVELGTAFGKSGKSAERLGVRLVDKAINDLRIARPQSASCALSNRGRFSSCSLRR